MAKEERWAIKVHGIQMPGFSTKGEVQKFIDEDKSFKGTDAMPVKLFGEAPKGTYLSDRCSKDA